MTALFTSTDVMRADGLTGFLTIAQLHHSKLKEVPRKRGIYFVLRLTSTPPLFRDVSTGGYHKGKDPTVEKEVLASRWIASSPVVYIGKAGATDNVSCLRSRLTAYLSFGKGSRSGHWGGRYIWQLADANDLVVCWKTIEDTEPRSVEKQLIQEFIEQFRARPFANCTG